jgi:hypothetical protein
MQNYPKLLKVFSKKRTKKSSCTPIVVETNIPYALAYWIKECRTHKNLYFILE